MRLDVMQFGAIDTTPRVQYRRHPVTKELQYRLVWETDSFAGFFSSAWKSIKEFGKEALEVGKEYLTGEKQTAAMLASQEKIAQQRLEAEMALAREERETRIQQYLPWIIGGGTILFAVIFLLRR